MKHQAALLLARLSGKEPTRADVTKILHAVGIEPDACMLDRLFSSIEGRDIDELIAQGSAKLACVASSGAVNVAPTAASAPEKLVEAVEEKEEEQSDEDMGFSLFD